MDEQTNDDGSTMSHITQLIAQAGNTGLTIWSNLTGKPIITGQVAGSPVPLAQAQTALSSGLLLVGIVVIAVVLLSSKKS